MVYGTYNYNIVTGAFVNQRSHHWGASLCRYVQNISSAIVNLLLSMPHWESTQNLKKKKDHHPSSNIGISPGWWLTYPYG